MSTRNHWTRQPSSFFEERLFEVGDEGGSPPGMSEVLTSSCSGSDPTEITEYPVILEDLAASVSLSPETILSLLVPALRHVLPALLSWPWLRRLEGPGEMLLLDRDFVISLFFRFSGTGGRKEVRRSRGVGIELTDGVDWAAGSGVNDDRDRLNGRLSLNAVGGWTGGVAELGVEGWPMSMLVLGVETPSLLVLRVIGPRNSKGEGLFSAN